jgi:hypothetical protein
MTMMNKRELEQWLGDGELDSRPVALTEVAEVLHVVLDASRRPLAIAGIEEIRELRFALAVLRDAFPSDDDVRAWLTTPSAEIQDAVPADLLTGDRIPEFVNLAIAEWNKPRGLRSGRPGAMFVRT